MTRRCHSKKHKLLLSPYSHSFEPLLNRFDLDESCAICLLVCGDESVGDCVRRSMLSRT